MSSSTTKMIVLKSSDNEYFEVEEAVALLSHTIKHMIEDGYANSIIPVPIVRGEILANVIDYCKFHAKSCDGDEKEKDEVKKFDDKLMKNLDHSTLCDMIMAANYLDIRSLLDLTCQTMADGIKNKSVEEVRKIFNITNDFSPEEEDALRKENAWAFE